jgi:drug/metabolite transporter (DMT)-like permease
MLIAILGGLGAAAAWTLSTICSSRSSRMLEPAAVVAWVMLVGFVVAVPLALARGIPSAIVHTPGLWLALAGAGNVGGLLLAYQAMRAGRVALVAPVLSSEGAMAALIAILVGESIAPRVGVTLTVIVIGIALAAIPGGSGGESVHHRHGRAMVFAIGGALAFGASLYAAGRAGNALPAAWVAAAARIIGLPVLVAPLALRGGLRLTRSAAPLVLASGLAEVAGFYAYTAGARHGIAIAAVLSSQFGSLAALVGYLFFGERLSATQICGVAATVAGVAVLSALQA